LGEGLGVRVLEDPSQFIFQIFFPKIYEQFFIKIDA